MTIAVNSDAKQQIKTKPWLLLNIFYYLESINLIKSLLAINLPHNIPENIEIQAKINWSFKP